MAFSVDYFHARVLAEIESWPVDVLADYARIIELLIEHGPNLKLPYSRAFGDGLFELILGHAGSGAGRVNRKALSITQACKTFGFVWSPA